MYQSLRGFVFYKYHLPKQLGLQLYLPVSVGNNNFKTKMIAHGHNLKPTFLVKQWTLDVFNVESKRFPWGPEFLVHNGLMIHIWGSPYGTPRNNWMVYSWWFGGTTILGNHHLIAMQANTMICIITYTYHMYTIIIYYFYCHTPLKCFLPQTTPRLAATSDLKTNNYKKKIKTNHRHPKKKETRQFSEITPDKMAQPLSCTMSQRPKWPP